MFNLGQSQFTSVNRMAWYMQNVIYYNYLNSEGVLTFIINNETEKIINNMKLYINVINNTSFHSAVNFSDSDAIVWSYN